MQLGGAHRGAPSESELFQSLQVYLKNKNRLQPIIGLGSITECAKADACKREAFYLCEVCVCRLNKADMRNHIMGSLHRYNYIKAKHPHFVAEWKENADLSKLAWPLMEMANILERREGPGDVQVLECEEALYDKMVSQNENDAVAMLHTSTRGRGQRGSKCRPEHCAVRSQRIDPPARTHRGQSRAAPSVKSKIIYASQPGDAARSQEASALSEKENYDYEPLIGLSWVVECRGEEDGRTYSFLCHCCRIRSNKEDLIDHLTSSSHLLNYMMEAHPEQVEAVMADTDENSGLLLSWAKKVEQREGRGEMKVVSVPASLCSLLTGRSYHWCITMLSSENGWTGTNTQKRKMAVEGPTVGVNEASNEDMRQKCDAVPSNPAERVTPKGGKIRKVNTVFKVSLPLTEGSLLLERTSFSPASPTCFTSPHSESQTVDSELDHDSGSRDINDSENASICTTSRPQPDVFSGDADTDVFVGPEGNLTCTLYRGVDGDVGDDQNFYESIYISGLKPRCDSFLREQQDGIMSACSVSEKDECYGERHYDRSWNSGVEEENGPVVYHTQDRCASASHHRGEAGYTQQWQQSPQGEVGRRVYMQREAQRHQQYMMQDHPSLPAAIEGHRGFSGGFAPRGLTGDKLVHCGSIGSLEMRRRGLQTSGCTELTFWHVPTAPQTCTTHPTVYRAIRAGCGVISDPRINPEQHLPQPSSSGGGALSHTDIFTPPGPAHGYEIHHSDLNSRGSADCFGGVVTSGNVDCTPTHMIPCPTAGFDSAYTTASHWYRFTAQNTGVPLESNHTRGVQHLL